MSQNTKEETPAVFVTGSILRHILVLTATSSIGLMSIFLVDFANLFYISLLGKQELAAAVGYAGTIMFFNISVAIGAMIAGIALVSRAMGAGNRQRARSIAGSAILFTGLSLTILSALYFPFIETSLIFLGAEGRTLEITVGFLQIVIPSAPFLGIGICASGLLRAIGDAKRAMYVTLSAGVVAAVLDPIFIFALELGINGAAYVTAISRLFTVGFGLYGLISVHNMLELPSFSTFFSDVRKLLDVAVPAVLTNIATPVSNAYVTSAMAPYGDEAVAGWAIIGRLIPVAFGFIFSLSGAVGPIVGQNYGARDFIRVRRTITNSLYVTIVYTLIIWFVLFLLSDVIVSTFNATGRSADLIIFFIYFVLASFLFNGALFVANAAFNNLGFATYSTVLNWGKATIGTVPFVWAGSYIGGAEGVLAGQGVGAVVFGVLAIVVCMWAVKHLDQSPPGDNPKPPLWRSALSAFSSGKSAGLS